MKDWTEILVEQDVGYLVGKIYGLLILFFVISMILKMDFIYFKGKLALFLKIT